MGHPRYPAHPASTMLWGCYVQNFLEHTIGSWNYRGIIKKKGYVTLHYGTEFLELQTLFVKKFAQYMASHIKTEIYLSTFFQPLWVNLWIFCTAKTDTERVWIMNFKFYAAINK